MEEPAGPFGPHYIKCCHILTRTAPAISANVVHRNLQSGCFATLKIICSLNWRVNFGPVLELGSREGNGYVANCLPADPQWIFCFFIKALPDTLCAIDAHFN